MVSLRQCRSRGPPPRRPGRSNMDLRQTAVNTLGYQLECAPKLRPPAHRHRGSAPWPANVDAAPGLAAGSGWTKRSSGWSQAVGQALKQVSSTPNQRIEVSDRHGERSGRERPRRGRVASCDNFLLPQAASRAALHAQIGSRNVTSVSSSNSTDLGYGVLALKSAQLTRTARQLRRAARPLRPGPAVAGQ
jgi:hypothetical protein